MPASPTPADAETTAPAADLAEIFAPHDTESTQTIDHGPWATLLDRHASIDPTGQGLFDYARVTDAEKRQLQTYVHGLEALDPRRLDRDEQLAYWANLYNAATVKVMLDHWPVESILEIDLEPGGSEGGQGPWDAPLLEVAGQRLSLNDIEHRIMRPIWQEPRIHYMVNCASIGCPNLALRPWTSENLDARLDAAATAFVDHPRAARIEGRDPGDRRLVLSSLYDWYRGDFVDDPGSAETAVEHLLDHAEGPIANQLEAWNGPIDYDYDWAVNAPRE